MWLIPLEHILHYCVPRKSAGSLVATIKGDLSALAFSNKAKGLLDLTGAFQVCKMLEGWAREGRPIPDQREPFSLQVLRGLKAAWLRVCISQFEALLFHAASLTAFFGAFHVSDLVVRSCSDSGVVAQLWSDVVLSGGGRFLYSFIVQRWISTERGLRWFWGVAGRKTCA